MLLANLPRDLRWLFLAHLLWATGSGVHMYTLPVYATELGASPLQVGVLMASGFVSATLSLLPAGWLTDHYERRSVMLCGWAFGCLAGITYLLADRWEWLVLGRMLHGANWLALTPSQRYVLDADTSGRPAYTLSVVFAAFPLGMVLSPVAGGQMATYFGPRSVFLMTTLFYLLSTVTLLPMRRQWPRALSAARIHSLRQLGSALMHWRLAPASIWRVTLLVVSGEALVALTVALGQVYMADAAGAGYGWIGGLGSLAALGAAVFGPFFGRMAETSSHRRALQGAALFTVLYAVLLLAVPRVAVVAAVAFLLRGAMEGTRQVRTAAVAVQASPQVVSQALSLVNISWGVYSAVGSYLGGWLYQVDRTLPFWLTAAGGVLYIGALDIALRQGRLPHPVTREAER